MNKLARMIWDLETRVTGKDRGMGTGPSKEGEQVVGDGSVGDLEDPNNETSLNKSICIMSSIEVRV